MRGPADLDDRFVPRLARALQRALDAGRTRLRRTAAGTAAGLERVARRAPAPLRRLDERAAAGPLSPLVARPDVVAGLVGLLLVVGAAGALDQRTGQPAGPGSDDAAVEAPAPDGLGPLLGTPVEDYRRRSQLRAVGLSRTRPDTSYLALVSLGRYLTPGEAARLAGPLAVQRAYVRVPSAGPAAQVLAAPVTALPGSLDTYYSETAARRADDVREQAALLRTLPPGQDRDRAQVAAQTAAREVNAYRSGCACVFALLVRAPARALAELPAIPEVRAVDVAAVDAQVEGLTVRPLLPEQTVAGPVG